MSLPVLSIQEFYTRVADYKYRLDPTWDEEAWQAQLLEERELLAGAMGEADNQSVLDCSCGSGGQAIPLAKLGWRVTASDITEASLNLAKQRARQQKVDVDFRVSDMRAFRRNFQQSFDWVISCMAIDNLIDDEDIQLVLRGMYGTLVPGGKCYIRLRDFDNLMEVKPRYEFCEDRPIPHGRVIRLEDWDYQSDKQVVCIYVFLWEDYQKVGYRWTTDIFAFKRRALRKAELKRFLIEAGFRAVEFLPQLTPWHPYAVVASS